MDPLWAHAPLAGPAPARLLRRGRARGRSPGRRGDVGAALRLVRRERGARRRAGGADHVRRGPFAPPERDLARGDGRRAARGADRPHRPRARPRARRDPAHRRPVPVARRPRRDAVADGRAGGRAAASPARARSAALDHVTRLDGADGPGLWIAAEAARFIGVGPGDSLYLRYERGHPPVRVTIDGIYRELWREQPRPYWRTLRGLIYERNPDAGPPPTFLIGDLDQVIALAAPRRRVPGRAPRLAARDDVADARGGGEDGGRPARRFRRRLRIPRRPSAGRSGASRAPRDSFGERIELSGQLGSAVTAARSRVATLAARSTSSPSPESSSRSPCSPRAPASRSRRVGSRRASSSRTGTARCRSAREASSRRFCRAVAGAALGFGLALLAVELLGPGEVESRALEDAVLAALVAVPAALALVGVVAVAVYLRATPRRPRARRSLLRVRPWELALVAAAAYALWRLRADGAYRDAGDGEAARSSWAVLLVPVLLLGAASALAARGLSWVFRRIPARTARAPAGDAPRRSPAGRGRAARHGSRGRDGARCGHARLRAGARPLAGRDGRGARIPLRRERPAGIHEREPRRSRGSGRARHDRDEDQRPGHGRRGGRGRARRGRSDARRRRLLGRRLVGRDAPRSDARPARARRRPGGDRRR